MLKKGNNRAKKGARAARGKTQRTTGGEATSLDGYDWARKGWAEIMAEIPVHKEILEKKEKKEKEKKKD